MPENAVGTSTAIGAAGTTGATGAGGATGARGPAAAGAVGTRMTVAVASGRALEVLVAGPEDGLALVFHNGTPGGLVAFGPMTAAAAARGLRTVMYAARLRGVDAAAGAPGRGRGRGRRCRAGRAGR